MAAAALSIVGTPAVCALPAGQVMVAGHANFSTNNFAAAGAVFDLSTYVKPLTTLHITVSQSCAYLLQQDYANADPTNGKALIVGFNMGNAEAVADATNMLAVNAHVDFFAIGHQVIA